MQGYGWEVYVTKEAEGNNKSHRDKTHVCWVNIETFVKDILAVQGTQNPGEEVLCVCLISISHGETQS